MSSYTNLYRPAYRQSTNYRQQVQYSQGSMCCSGYTGTPPNCDRKC